MPMQKGSISFLEFFSVCWSPQLLLRDIKMSLWWRGALLCCVAPRVIRAKLSPCFPLFQ